MVRLITPCSIGYWALLLHLSRSTCFSFVHSQFPASAKSPTFLLHATSKRSMTQRRKNRAKRMQQSNPYANLPRPTTRPDEREKKESTTTADEQSSKTPESITKAKQLIEAQKESVAMLGHVRDRVLNIDAQALNHALESKGYYYLDNFLGSPDITKKLESEGKSLLEKELMQVDMEAIGQGEYICSIQGGQDQYPQCPRSIEFVVAMTKHFPSETVDKTKTMAIMRTFSRKSWRASLQLLMGASDGAENHDVDQEPSPRAFRTVRNDANDARQLSMTYYLVPENWSFGGGLVFGEQSVDKVEARRDRLVIWKSDQSYRPEAWRGSEDFPLASCIELHLLE